jgi:hypothetical protein
MKLRYQVTALLLNLALASFAGFWLGSFFGLMNEVVRIYLPHIPLPPEAFILIATFCFLPALHWVRIQAHPQGEKWGLRTYRKGEA